jgi:hypothetical protein
VTLIPPASDNPLDIPPGTEVNPAPYLGSWNLQQVEGLVPDQAVTLTVQQSGADLTASYSDGSESETEIVVLTQINGEVIASLRDASGNWNILMLSLLSNATVMSVGQIDRNIIATDIQSGLVAGEVDDWDVDEKVIHITASPSELRAYLGNKTNIFVSGALIFQR